MKTNYLGEEIKIQVRAKPIDGMTLADYEWVAQLWTSSYRVVEVPKHECIPMDDGSYVIILDTSNVGVGALKLKIVAELPDGDFEDGFKTTIGVVKGITQIVKSNGGRCIEIDTEVLSSALELEVSIVCEPWLGWEEYVDLNGDTYITIDGKKYKVKKR